MEQSPKTPTTDLTDSVVELARRVEREITRNLATVVRSKPSLPRNEQDALDFVNRFVVPQGIRATRIAYDQEERTITIHEWAFTNPIEVFDVKVEI